ncbi:MAG: RidA family protein [Bacteroidia bacterium]|nr:RidA family protein [Bacteroidia bacterium]MCO5253156.1 RidA family protein [Bacteroidota bacterium]
MTHKVITSPQAPAPIGPYSHAREFNGLVFISGQIPINPATGKMIQDSIAAETHQVLDNMKAILTEAGLTFSDIIKTTIFITNMGDFQEVNNVYASYFTDVFPARETVQVTALPAGARVEISCIAGK